MSPKQRRQPSLLSSLQLGGTRQHQAKIRWSAPLPPLPDGHLTTNYTIFEGTSEIQRLVIARSISGAHIP
jgi:alkylation response protein AidB-like acyl-CoA dehydrogenase